MTEVTAARDARARQRTWVVGGIMVLLAALVGFVARFQLAEFHHAKDVLWAAGALVLVIGLGRAGSITGRRPLATSVAAGQVLLASPPVAIYLSGLVPHDPSNPHAEEDAWGSVMFPYFAAVALVTVVAVLLIGFADALPRPWSWAPAWVTALSALSSAASILFFARNEASDIASRVLYEVPGVGMASLGVLAILLGARATRRGLGAQRGVRQ